jgi:hypothetical protein
MSKRILIALPLVLFLILLCWLTPTPPAGAYPIDGYALTEVSRLRYQQLVQDSTLRGRRLKPGQLHSIFEMRLNLLHQPLDSLPPSDSALQAQLHTLLPNLNESYSVALFDITPGREPRYAARQANRGFQPGSVGKLAVITALFCELENLFVDDFDRRLELLMNKRVRSNRFGVPNQHTVPFFNVADNRYFRRKVNENDEFTLYEWLDHMVSVSSNAAAAIVWREAILMRVFQDRYPELTDAEAREYFRTTDRRELSDIGNSVVNEPLRHLGIGRDEWRLGTMFTRGGSAIVPPQGGSIGTPRGLMKWLFALEKGRVIDVRSSLEIKRMMYLTDRRIRYAASPSLDSALVFFKSGSLYGCGGTGPCGKYRGNSMNYMNSVAIVEQPDRTRYLVTLMTNVLRKNSAYDHLILAGRIDRLLRPRAKKKDDSAVARSDVEGTGD